MLLSMLSLVGVTEAKSSSITYQANGEGKGRFQPGSVTQYLYPKVSLMSNLKGVKSKANIQKTKIMASGPITSWQIDGETMETVTDFIFGGCEITADGDCSHEIKRRLLLGRKVMTKIDSILNSRDITLPTKICLVRAMVYPAVMYGCKS